MFSWPDTNIRILREKVSALKSAFQPFIDALHPENKPSIEHAHPEIAEAIS